MIAYFKDRNSFQVPALLFVALALKLVFINYPHYDAGSQPGGLLSQWLSLKVMVWLNPAFAATLSQIIIFLSALFASYLLISCRMFGRNNLLVALSILLFTSLFPASNQLSPATLMLPLSILLFRQVTQLYNRTAARPVIINLGMIAGLGYLLYHPFAWLIPFCFVGLAGMRPFKITEWLLLLAGIITPAYFLLSYQFFTDQLHVKEHFISWNYYSQFPHFSMYTWIAAAAALIWILAAIPLWQGQMRRMLIQSRKNWYQLMFMGIFILPMALVPKGNIAETITLLSFPAGSLAANVFQGENKLFPLILFWVLIACIGVAAWGFIH